MNKLLLINGAVLGLISVIMGALGDHAFALHQEQIKSLDTAIRYSMIYGVLIICIALSPRNTQFIIANTLLAFGSTLFSFSIYIAILSDIQQFTYLTPFGGILIMTGWGYLIYLALKLKNN